MPTRNFLLEVFAGWSEWTKAVCALAFSFGHSPRGVTATSTHMHYSTTSTALLVACWCGCSSWCLRCCLWCSLLCSGSTDRLWFKELIIATLVAVVSWRYRRRLLWCSALTNPAIATGIRATIEQIIDLGIDLVCPVQGEKPRRDYKRNTCIQAVLAWSHVVQARLWRNFCFRRMIKYFHHRITPTWMTEQAGLGSLESSPIMVDSRPRIQCRRRTVSWSFAYLANK